MSLYNEVKEALPKTEPKPEPEPKPKKKEFRDAWEVKYLTTCWKCGADFSKNLIRCPGCNTPNKKYLPRPMEAPVGT